MRKLILPKGIKRKNQEGYELIDFTCPADDDADNFPNLFDRLFNQEEAEEIRGDMSESDASSSDVDDENLEELTAAAAFPPHVPDVETAGIMLLL